ncbi:lipocalin family protein [Porticoccaceae bacterium]|nr:lipocalin family protein [Porticoccaceae bacterium]MDB9706888.1 lipocalin family protein [Porticoccaceae bacterium]MDB9805725.1 lipocalin family protein [Porticoccaceae bacterium]
MATFFESIRIKAINVEKIALLLSALLLASCLGRPDGVSPVEQLDTQRYLGTWYEVARLDHSFERGLSNVTADYSMREDGGLRVINRGYSTEEGDWQQAEGRAYTIEEDQPGHLKVSFFGPFFGSYVVFELDPDYQYAFVAGNTTNYLWLLARTPAISDELKTHFLQRAESLGFAVDELIFVDQSLNQNPVDSKVVPSSP